MMFLLASLLAIGIQAYSPGNAPIQWVRSQTKNHAKPLVIAPKGFAGHSWDLFTPQKLTLRDTSDKVSPDTIPYFSVMLDESIVWGAKGWCIGTDANRDVVVDHCTGVPAQKWKWIPDGLGRNRIQLKNTNWCLAAGNDAGLNGTPVVLRDCQSRKTEMWKFEEPIALPTPVTVLNHVFSSHIRHVLVSLLALAGVGALAFGAWFWQRSTKKTCCVALSQGSVPAGVERREGVLVSTFFATNTKRDQLVEEQDANNELSQQKVALEIDLGADGEPAGVTRLKFKPLLRRSVLFQVDLRLPLGLNIEETDAGDIVVTGALPGFSAFKEVEVGDLIRAVTAYREIMSGAPMWQQLFSYNPVGKMQNKRLIFRTEGATYADLKDSIASHRVDQGGNGIATLVLERAVNESTPMTPRSAQTTQLEPLQDVILEDLQTKPVEDAVEEKIKTMTPQERARRLFQLGMGPDPDK